MLDIVRVAGLPVPDDVADADLLPGCISTRKTLADVEANMREAIEFHVEGLKLDGDVVPEPTAYGAYVQISA